MKEVRCEQCPLRPLPLFLENSAEEVNLVQSLKRREARLGAGETLIFEGQTDAPLYTLLDQSTQVKPDRTSSTLFLSHVSSVRLKVEQDQLVSGI